MGPNPDLAGSSAELDLQFIHYICTVGTQEEGGDQGYPSYRNITNDVYIDFENMNRENVEKKQSNYRALDSLCKSKFGNQATAGAMDCRYFKH